MYEYIRDGYEDVEVFNVDVWRFADLIRNMAYKGEWEEVFRFLAKYPHRINSDGDLVIYSQRYRDQVRNREDCLEKLRQLIMSVRGPPKSRRLTLPSRSSRERRLREKHQKSEKKRRRRQPPPTD